MEEAPIQPRPKGIGGILAGISNFLKNALSSIRSFLMVILVVLLIAINCIFAYWIYTMASNFQAQLSNIADAQAKIQKQAAEQSKKTGGAAQPVNENPALREAPQYSGVPSEIIKAGQGIQYDVGPKVINLADPGGRRYIKINVILEYAPNDISYFLEKEAAKSGESGAAAGAKKEGAVVTVSYVDKFKQELEQKRPLLDDTIITLVSSKTFENIYTASGKEQLKKEMMTLLNGRMPEYKVIFVYFSEFTVQ
ncbi:MAG: flagellar basal body-associated FliL family protein [Chloroflexota bacterium]